MIWKRETGKKRLEYPWAQNDQQRIWKTRDHKIIITASSINKAHRKQASRIPFQRTLQQGADSDSSSDSKDDSRQKTASVMTAAMNTTVTCEVSAIFVWRFDSWSTIFDPDSNSFRESKQTAGREWFNCLSNAMHGHNINLPVCMSLCVCVCPSHFLSTRLQVRPLNGFLQLIA